MASRPRHGFDSGHFWQMIAEAAWSIGLDTRDLFDGAGPPRYGQRVPHDRQQAFWKGLEGHDPWQADPVLRLAERMQPLRGLPLEFGFLSSATVEEGLRFVIAHQRLVTDVAGVRLERQGSTAVLSHFRHPLAAFEKLAILISLRFLHPLTGGAFVPREIWLTSPVPSGASWCDLYPGCQVRGEMPDAAIHFEAALLDRKLPTADPGIHRLHRKCAAEQLSLIPIQEREHAIRERLMACLPMGNGTLTSVCEELGIPPRTLRHDLAKIGTHFNRIHEECRKTVACRLLRRPESVMDQVIYATGFSEPSAFSRAFKRWTGMTPREYQQQHAGH